MLTVEISKYRFSSHNKFFLYPEVEEFCSLVNNQNIKAEFDIIECGYDLDRTNDRRLIGYFGHNSTGNLKPLNKESQLLILTINAPLDFHNNGEIKSLLEKLYIRDPKTPERKRLRLFSSDVLDKNIKIQKNRIYSLKTNTRTIFNLMNEDNENKYELKDLIFIEIYDHYNYDERYIIYNDIDINEQVDTSDKYYYSHEVVDIDNYVENNFSTFELITTVADLEVNKDILLQFINMIPKEKY